MSDKILRIAFPYDKPVSFYDPLKIHLSPEYTFLENTFSPLVEHTPEGELVSAVAEKFFWVDNEAQFHIRKNLKTVDGRDINAHDVANSIKRLIILSGATHGDLKGMLCPDATLKDLNDPCPGLKVVNDHVLILSFKERKPFLFPMLAALDFAIIPTGSIDPDTLAIVDYRNTSGPYFVERDHGNGRVDLAANPHHFHFSNRMPTKLQLVPIPMSEPGRSLEMLKQGEVDLVTTIDHATHDLMIRFVRENSDFNLHATYPLRTYTVTFTKKGRTRLSLQNRLAIGKTLRSLFRKWMAEKDGFTPIDQLFPALGEGALSKEQEDKLQLAFENAPEPAAIDYSLTGWIIRIGTFDPQMASLKMAFPNSTFIASNKLPSMMDFSKNPDEEPDFTISGPDMGFLEDIGLISHYLNVSLFHLTPAEGKKWLANYMAQPEKSQRLGILRELHLKTIAEGASIPMAVSPYTAVVRKPWKFNLSKVQASDSVWRITQD